MTCTRPALRCDKNDVEIAMDAAVLKCLVEYEHVSAACNRACRTRHTVAPDDDRDVGIQRRVKRGLVGCITTVKYRRRATRIAKRACQPRRYRCLARPPDRDIADTDH